MKKIMLVVLAVLMLSFVAVSAQETQTVTEIKWEDVAEKVNPAYQDPLPELGDDEKVFTYTFQVYEGRALSELFNDMTYVYITDKDNCLFTDLFFYAKPSEMDDTFASVCGKVEAAGYTAAVEEAGVSIYTLKDAGENVISQIDVFENDAYIEVYYFGIPFCTDFEDFAGVKALYEKRAGKLVTGFESALVDTAVAGENYHLDYSKETYFYYISIFNSSRIKFYRLMRSIIYFIIPFW